MLEWLWICMVIALKAAIGSFLWSMAIMIVLSFVYIVIAIIMVSVVALISIFVKDKKN